MAQLYRFKSPYGRYGFTVPLDVEDGDHVRKYLKRTNLVFEQQSDGTGSFTTTDVRVAKFLRRLASTRSMQYREDFTQFPLTCDVPGCDWTYENSSEAAHQARYDHLLADHADILMGPEKETEKAAPQKETPKK